MKKCIIIPDSFKGTMSAMEFCGIGEQVIRRHIPQCQVVSIPVADGGEGTVDCFVHALHAQKITLTVKGPWKENVSAAYAVSGDTAFVEMAQAAGLPMVGDRKNPAKTTTFGVGTIIRDAVLRGCLLYTSYIYHETRRKSCYCYRRKPWSGQRHCQEAGRRGRKSHYRRHAPG